MDHGREGWSRASPHRHHRIDGIGPSQIICYVKIKAPWLDWFADKYSQYTGLKIEVSIKEVAMRWTVSIDLHWSLEYLQINLSMSSNRGNSNCQWIVLYYIYLLWGKHSPPQEVNKESGRKQSTEANYIHFKITKKERKKKGETNWESTRNPAPPKPTYKGRGEREIKSIELNIYIYIYIY